MGDFTYDFGRQWTLVGDKYHTTCGCSAEKHEQIITIFPCTLHVGYWADTEHYYAEAE